MLIEHVSMSLPSALSCIAESLAIALNKPSRSYTNNMSEEAPTYYSVRGKHGWAQVAEPVRMSRTRVWGETPVTKAPVHRFPGQGVADPWWWAWWW
eukprot:SAG11_NODE_366_length_10128_cov_4.162030_4_plen_96_part_00